MDPEGYEPRGNWYDTAQVCMNDHVITDRLNAAREQGQQYCSDCGQPTISACQSCSEPIRGYYHIAGVNYPSNFAPPKYCGACGAAFPWTAKTLEAASELADELALTEEERSVVKERFPEIAQDTPSAQAGAYKIKRLLEKARGGGSIVVGVLYKVAIDFASETTKKILMDL